MADHSDYPVTSGGYDDSYNGGVDGFASKLDSFISADNSGSGFQSGSFLAETGPSFVFDADGVLNVSCN